ncbi:hypothetical protein F1880_008678 [Penicillium rolfsii]|nr:hypothetical protein F1880_008678 [Penicillium rolfsii]
MFTWLKTFLAGKTSTNWRRKRANRAYHKKVRARERQLRRQWHHEEVADRFFYWAPYSSQRPSKEAVKVHKERKDSGKGKGK